MHVHTVIYTDRLPEVEAFYRRAFPNVAFDAQDGMFTFRWASNGWLHFVRSDADHPPSAVVLMRLQLPYTDLEHERLTALGIPCGALTVESWGNWYGQNVRYFEVIDPAGTRLHFYEPHFGEKRQLMTTGDGTGTRKVHQHG
jgi:hypothetical protein